jgi:hypothetical protein
MDPELSSRYWLVRKVCAILGYYGGLRNIELRSIEFGKIFEGGEKSFETDQTGYWFAFERRKQRGLPETSVFCIPRRQSDWLPVVSSSARSPVDFDPASVVDQYLHLIESDLGLTRDQLRGSFFKSTHGKNGKFFRNIPMGKNILTKVGHKFAEELFLPSLHSFTGHCWRRSCGTNASDAGVNVTTLMAQLGWSTPKTAIGYVKKSRRTSFQMSMFLSNVQRQDKDLDQILVALKLHLVGIVVAQSEKSSSSKGKKISKVVPATVVSSDLIPDVDESLVNKFSASVSSSKRSESVCRTREAQKMEAETHSILADINGSASTAPKVETVQLADQQGSGSGVESSSLIIGGGCGGDDLGVVGPASISSEHKIDPRVSSILNNIRNNGAIHVHFHFSK